MSTTASYAPFRIPAAAWTRALGLPLANPPVARSDGEPLIDDGAWGGVPIGGLGSGSIGRTHGGDFARWHLDIGRHRFAPSSVCQFSLFVERQDGSRESHVLSTLRPADGHGWTWDYPMGAGTYAALF